ncbi:hypothetical protein [Noviherbaspirillum sp. UKPF54]|uniref:hypothetical protein n=1 Tax=Noviherbaspirillum sp. UKPF54 TaxID=2601898 RepID=UPI0011B11347|nr:hypothetical protein [Noviherbaspirillum sp. UKPF54]QDZ27479.1 hypothetical protein FAY22_05625 [Noviherbaspirillum sp. UKPF54]
MLKSKSFVRALLRRNGSWKYLNSSQIFRGVNKNNGEVANKRHAKKEKAGISAGLFFALIELFE